MIFIYLSRELRKYSKGPEVAESVNTDCRAGKSVSAAFKSITGSQGTAGCVGISDLEGQ